MTVTADKVAPSVSYEGLLLTVLVKKMKRYIPKTYPIQEFVLKPYPVYN